MDYHYSIIIPFRDKYDLFVKAIDSIPDREDIQIIIVDNAPQPIGEKSVPAKELSKVVYSVSSPTKGAGCARNVGLQRVEGKFIVFLDADDYFTTDAFKAFDAYLDKEYDIVYFDADSISLTDGAKSNRHHTIHKKIQKFLEEGDEDILRYCFFNPISKMLKAEFVLNSGIKFDEIPVSNDVWFSFMTGHKAKSITADPSVVYMITEGEMGSSLVKKKTKENMFTRFKVQVKVNIFLKSIGKYHLRVRLLGALKIAYKNFGIKEFFRYVRYAMVNKVGVV